MRQVKSAESVKFGVLSSLGCCAVAGKEREGEEKSPGVLTITGWRILLRKASSHGAKDVECRERRRMPG